MRRLVLVAVVAALCAGCASGGLGGSARESSTDAAHATALYRLGRLHADPSSGMLDHAAALGAFERLLAAYPGSAWEPEARAWRTTLLEMEARETEAARLRREVARLEADLKTRTAQSARLTGETAKLREEAARLRDETAKLKADLERLKRIDLNFERRR